MGANHEGRWDGTSSRDELEINGINHEIYLWDGDDDLKTHTTNNLMPILAEETTGSKSITRLSPTQR